MRFAARDLPAGLSLDPETGRITGALSERGRHAVTLQAQNSRGTAERLFTIVVGDEIALTPPLGWNSWNIWGGGVTQEKVHAAAQALVASGLREHGWTYINLDDGWQGRRGGDFNAIQPNAKFPDLAALAEEVHSLGLKLGIYSSPWRTTFNFNIGSSADRADGGYTWIDRGEHNQNFHYRFPPNQSWLARQRWLAPLHYRMEKRRQSALKAELRAFGGHSFVAADVAQWAAWGVDYLKYDWVPIDVAHVEEMGAALARCGRDIVYSVSNNTALGVAAEVSARANSWRTSSDVMDTWDDVRGIGFTRDRWAPFQRPGHCNDPDMLVIGEVGWGHPRQTRLTSAEQYAHVSLWALLGGPLLLGCDLEKLDPFTLGLITNDEVLDLNQDLLGKQAIRIGGGWRTDVFAKPLEDGSWALGFFNRGEKRAQVQLPLPKLGKAVAWSVRDVWRQRDLGEFSERFAMAVAPHGVVLVRAFSIAPQR